MKKALVSPAEKRFDGYRIADVSDEVFPVSEPLFWVECEDGVEIDLYWYDPADQSINPIPEPESPAVLAPEGQSTGTQSF